MHCSAFLVGGLKRAPQIFFLIFFVWVVLFGHNYGPVNQKKPHQNFSCKVGKSTSICAIDLAVKHYRFPFPPVASDWSKLPYFGVSVGCLEGVWEVSGGCLAHSGSCLGPIDAKSIAISPVEMIN